MKPPPPGLARLLPPLSAVVRGSTTVHAARLRWVEPGGSLEPFVYPEQTALCGVRGWGEASPSAPVTCGRCLRAVARLEQVDAPSRSG